MSKPALKASSEGVKQAQEAFTQRRFTQESLAHHLGCNRSVISKFFNGESIWEKYFTGICQELGIDWQKIVSGYVPPLVQEVRSKVRELIQEWCGSMRILDMTQPIKLSQIYTHVNILEKLTATRRKTIDELLKECEYEDFDRFGLGKVVEEKVPGVDAVNKYKKLIVLGKPGAGKTTFLKYLAIQCNQGNFQSNLVPIFIPLKYFAEASDKPSLFEYIKQQYSGCDVTAEQFDYVFKHGLALILLDGLDEVSIEHQERILKEVRNFSRIFFENHYIITCRIAAWEYTFDKFIEVEVADFDEQQVNEFAQHWFDSKLVKSADFINCLNQNNRAYQLAVTPLLLTLLCLVFEESGCLPNNRSELYREGLYILLKKWDAKRGIHRDEFYEKMSPTRKEDLLSRIAFTTFENYFFTPGEVKNIVEKYLSKISVHDNIPKSQVDVEELLNSIESQHGLVIERAKGIYSFSHITFHEYFIAKRIVSLSPQLDDESLQDEESPNIKELKKLVNQITNSKWQQVFLLVAEMLPDAEKLFLLMKQKADGILANNNRLQLYLRNVNEQSQLLQHPFEFSDDSARNRFYAAMRAFYFDIDYKIDQDRQLCIALDVRAKYLICGNCFTRILKDINNLQDGIFEAKKYDDSEPQQIINAVSADEIIKIAVEYGVKYQKIRQDKQGELEEIQRNFFEKIHDHQVDEERLKLGANLVRDVASKGTLAANKLASSLHDFSQEEQKLLKQYYDANKLLLDCLRTDCFVSRRVGDEIIKTLFLPQQTG